MLEAVEPFDQTFPEPYEEVNVTDPLPQIANDPLTAIEGVAGAAVTVIVSVAVPIHPAPLSAVTV
jgi:hypothetical protein